VIITGEVDAPPRPARTARDYVALAVATCGVGYIPVAPGTFGSLVGIAIYLGFRNGLLALAAGNRWNVLEVSYALVMIEVISIALIAVTGIWAASKVERILGKKDPGKVVVDEVAGQLVALTTVPLVFLSWWPIVLAFLLFRFFDIVKPYPAGKLESLSVGLGIMADDLVAGVYAAVVVGIVVGMNWVA
jgi:phosphatidylglycerophosphatase A